MNLDPVRDVAYSALALAWLCIVVTCSPTNRLTAAQATIPGLSVSSGGSLPSTRGSGAPSLARGVEHPEPGLPPPAEATSPPSPQDQLLSNFRQQLRELEQGVRERPVRIVWFGDSHTAADFWPHAVREPLQERFGKAGPGFVRLGIEPYRHGQARVTRTGRWRREPRSPASIERQLDGIFGLGGMFSVPQNWRAETQVEVAASAATGRLRYTLMYQLGKGAAFTVKLGANEQRVDEASSARSVPGSPIKRVELEADVGQPLWVGKASGRVALYGAFIDSEQPGVIVDTLGINGARLATVLSWDETVWVAELKAREPSLVILAFGTNEVLDAHAPEIYAGQIVALAGRVRRAAPDVSCLVVGPTDVAEHTGTSHPRVAEVTNAQRRGAAEVGCAFIGAQELMGGEGSYARWQRHDPPLARTDRVHLTVDGYRELGERLVPYLLAGF